jgi:hypothetical protein
MICSVYTYYAYVTLLLDLAVLAQNFIKNTNTKSAWCLRQSNGKYKVFLVDISATAVFAVGNGSAEAYFLNCVGVDRFQRAFCVMEDYL